MVRSEPLVCMWDKGALFISCILFAVEGGCKTGSQVIYGTAEIIVNSCLSVGRSVCHILNIYLD